MVLLSRSFTVVMSAVGFLMLPLYSNLSPPTHRCTLSESDLDVFCVQTMVMYVTLFFVGTFERGMKKPCWFLLCSQRLATVFPVLYTCPRHTCPCTRLVELDVCTPRLVQSCHLSWHWLTIGLIVPLVCPTWRGVLWPHLEVGAGVGVFILFAQEIPRAC